MVTSQVKNFDLDNRLMSLMFVSEREPRLSVEIKKLLKLPLKLLLLKSVVHKNGSYIKE